jgi:TonB family protein
MRHAQLLLVFLALTAGASAQQELAPTSQDGPMAVPSGPAAIPQPDANGIYRLGPGIVAPTIFTAEPAIYPVGAQESDVPHVGIYAVVVGTDGAANSVKCIFPNESVFDAGAIAAIQKSKFAPAMLGDTPVPVLVHVRVPFFHLKPAMPMILDRYVLHAEGRRQAPGRGPGAEPDAGFGPMNEAGVTPPKVIHAEDAEFSDEARRKGVEGYVVISFTVSEKGKPTDLRVVKSLGYGLDEKALESVRQYRFKPAMKDGKPVAKEVSVEVNFRTR